MRRRLEKGSQIARLTWSKEGLTVDEAGRSSAVCPSGWRLRRKR